MNWEQHDRSILIKPNNLFDGDVGSNTPLNGENAQDEIKGSPDLRQPGEPNLRLDYPGRY